jgi:nucleoside 2-deoxyribosyltransferase
MELQTNLLDKCSTYLAGPMEFQDGQGWRDYVESALAPLNLRIFNPYKNKFIRNFEESEEARQHLMKLREEGKFEELAVACKEIRIYDLSYVDRCDFLICYLNTKIFSLGTSEELIWANRLKKPIFVVVEQGKKAAPLWLFGMIPDRYIFDNFPALTDYIKQIACGEIKLTDNRLKLLQPEYR